MQTEKKKHTHTQEYESTFVACIFTYTYTTHIYIIYLCYKVPVHVTTFVYYVRTSGKKKHEN